MILRPLRSQSAGSSQSLGRAVLIALDPPESLTELIKSRRRRQLRSSQVSSVGLERVGVRTHRQTNGRTDGQISRPRFAHAPRKGTSNSLLLEREDILNAINYVCAAFQYRATLLLLLMPTTRPQCPRPETSRRALRSERAPLRNFAQYRSPTRPM